MSDVGGDRGLLRASGLSVFLAGATLALTLLSGCGSGGEQHQTQGGPPPGSIGVAGGTVVSADGRVVLTIPQNALTVDTVFTFGPGAGAPASSRVVGELVDIGPTGTTFLVPAQLSIAFAPLPAGIEASALKIGTVENGQWVEVGGSVTGGAITAQISHLSLYALLAPEQSPTSPDNQPPTAGTNGPYVATVGQAVPMRADGSSDPNGDRLTFSWDFGDGHTGSGYTTMHTYATPDVFTVTVTVTDEHGLSDVVTTTAAITEAPVVNLPPTIESTVIPPTGVVNQTVVFSGSASDPNGDLITYTWDFADGTSAASGPQAEHAFTAVGTYTVRLTVSDNRGGSAQATGTITIGAPTQPVAFSQDLTIFMRQYQAAIYTWKYAIVLSGTGTPPLTFKIVSLPAHQEPTLSNMALVAGSYYQWWDPVSGGWRLECRASPPASCKATTSSQVDLVTGDVIDPTTVPPQPIVVPSNVPPIVVYAPVVCSLWGPNPLTDSFAFTVTDSTGATSEPATVRITVADAICKGGTH